MKYLAILKDSFYETIDFKLFYVLIGLSIFLTVVTASFFFPRLPIDEVLDKNLNLPTWGERLREVQAGRMGTPPVNARYFQIENLETVEESLFSRHGRYRFSMTVDQKPGFFAWLKQVEHQHQQENSLPAALVGSQVEAEQRPPLGVADPSSNEGSRVQGFLRQLFSPPAKEPDEPKTADAWRARLQSYGDLIAGIQEFKILGFQTSPAGVPQQLDAEVLVNWADLRNAHQIGFVFGTWKFDLPLPLGVTVFIFFQNVLINMIAGWAGIIISLIITAGFVPNMLNKGTVDLLLVKPIHRWALLIYKYVGGLAFVFFNSIVLVGGTWIAFGFTTGNWSLWYLTSIFVLTFFFGVLYSLSVLMGVLTRSPLVSIFVTIGVWFLLFLISQVYQLLHLPQVEDEAPTWLVSTVDGIHYATPKPSALAILNNSLLLRANGSEDFLELQKQVLDNFSWGNTLITCGGFIVVMLGLACWRFSRRDY